MCMKPGLEEVVDAVYAHKQFFFTNAREEFFKQAIKSTKMNVTLYPDKYLCVDASIKGDGLWSVLDAASQRARREYFDFVQRHFFADEKLYRANDGFVVTTRDLGAPLPIMRTLRDTVATLRSTGLRVKWRNEKMIDRYGHAARSIYSEIAQKARHLQYEEDSYAREYHQ